MTNKHSTAHQAIQDAWDFWLSQNPISVPEIIEAAVAKAFEAWLCSEEERLIDAVAEKVAERLPDSIVEFLKSEKGDNSERWCCTVCAKAK
jgi:hypothetical protein